MKKWDVDDKSWETLLREKWEDAETWILADIMSKHKLSFDFLR